LWAVIGLGNPGRTYTGTRHNVGFRFIKRLARRWHVEIKRKKFSAKVAELKRSGERLVLAMPQTYMNLSGAAAKEILAGYGLAPENIVVVYDDLDIPVGQIRVRKAGSAGGHKGMRSIVADIGTSTFPRIRVGIGPLDEGEDAVRYVLSPFAEGERPAVEEALVEAEKALEFIIDGRIDQAMNVFNQKKNALA
jgi:PTH1 family peptidyl-tRNA hydrolase